LVLIILLFSDFTTKPPTLIIDAFFLLVESVQFIVVAVMKKEALI
jgi:hypothetical protein